MKFPLQVSSASTGARPAAAAGKFDMRDGLSPRWLTIVMWDQAFLLRHDQGCSFQDYDRVLDETVARGDNTVRIEPMAQLLDLTHLERVNTWDDPQTPYMPWGWTPHNYCQPQFANRQDFRWHGRLTDRLIRS